MSQETAEGSFMFEPDKSFILSYHFVGYVGDVNSDIVTKAIEVGAEEEVLIFFIKTDQTEGREQMMIRYLLNHQVFQRVKYIKPLRNSTAFITEYCAWPSLSEYVRRKGAIAEAGIYKIFIQLLDAVTYLHTYGIVCNGIKPDSILISNKLEVKIANLRKSAFYNLNKAYENEKNDICAIGKVVMFLFSGELGGLKWDDEKLLEFTLSRASEYQLIESLKYIFKHKKTLELSSLRSINNMENPYSKGAKPAVFVLDLLVVEVLATFGVDKIVITENVNNIFKKEHFMYLLCQRRVSEELRLTVPRIKLGSSRDKAICTMHNLRERQKKLLELKYHLYFNIAEECSSWIRAICCRPESVHKISVKILGPVHSGLRFMTRSGCKSYEIGSNAVRMVTKSAELEVSVVQNKKGLFNAERRKGNAIVFRQITGTMKEFVNLTISILEGITFKNAFG